MIRLAFSTSSPFASVALACQRTLKEITINRNDSPLSESLIDHIQRLLEENQVKPKDIDEIGIDEGPGSFTGIRVGIATANGLALGLKCPVKCFSSLNLLAVQFHLAQPGFKGPVLTGIPAGREEIYSAVFEIAPKFFQQTESDRLVSKKEFISLGKNKQVLGFGLDQSGISAHLLYPRAIDLLFLMKTSKTVRPFAVPNYVRLSYAEMNLKNSVFQKK